jgi:hypothetical protein
MAMQGLTECAAGCGAAISGANNLCDDHRVPGVAVRVGESTMVIAAWVAHRGDEVGIIFLNDLGLGELFGGRPGFEAKLQQQGFTNVRMISSRAELEALKMPNREGLAPWGGPWKAKYPWQSLK